jgi:hypothetical protein
MITEPKPWKCLTCKRKASDKEVRCACGDKLTNGRK